LHHVLKVRLLVNQTVFCHLDDGLSSLDPYKNVAESNLVVAEACPLNACIALDGRADQIVDFLLGEAHLVGDPAGNFFMEVDERVIDDDEHLLHLAKEPF
jgi:hypothetical protein